ncbi:hypothetical protein [Streptomyces hirsutus]|uniref:hypothetical protein n=1 Tax=Streptomyces hirsutus TaxID=35620 RepID=UPI003324ABD1
MQWPSAPTPHGERVIGTLWREALDHLLIRNETRARRVLDEYARHHNGHRPLGPAGDCHRSPNGGPHRSPA